MRGIFLLEHVESFDWDGRLSKEKYLLESFDSKLKDGVRINDGFDDGQTFKPIVVSWAPALVNFFYKAY